METRVLGWYIFRRGFHLYFGVNSQPGLGSNEETAALLPVLSYKMGNATFGSGFFALPQWAGPPHPIILVQATLFVSLGTLLMCAALVLFGKQWANHCDSAGMRETAAERGQDRRRKFDSIITWHFRYAMEALPFVTLPSLASVCFMPFSEFSSQLWGRFMRVVHIKPQSPKSSATC